MSIGASNNINSSPSDAATKVMRLLGVRSSVAPDTAGQVTNQKAIAMVEKLTQQVAVADSRLDGQGRASEDLRERLGKQEEVVAKVRADAAYVQLLLEALATSMEKEKGIVSEHTEQLRFFATHSQQRTVGSGRSMYYVAVAWMYTPFLLFLKGVWLIFQPLVQTFRSLSLLNSAVLQEQQQRHDDATDDESPDEQQQLQLRKKGSSQRDPATSLLARLQQGALDPNKKKS